MPKRKIDTDTEIGISDKEYANDMRISRVMGSNRGGIDVKPVAGIKSRFNSDSIKSTNRTSLSMPLSINDRRETDIVAAAPPSIKSKLHNNADYQGMYKGITGIIKPEYNLLEPFAIYDTEIYVRQSVTRRLSLMFRNGWDVVSDIEHNQKNVDYIKKRLSTLEFVMAMPIQTFFEKILYDLLLTSNCFLYKIRDTKASPGVKNPGNKNRTPVAGYTFIPNHQIMPYFEMGQHIFWRRYFETGAPFEDIPLDDIIHLKWDVKNGHYFGTPRLIGVRDDIFALRRLEENIELLFINYLFPLFHVKVGNEAAPCWYGPQGESEIELIKASIEAMPKEGIFVTDERVEVDSVGAEGLALDTKDPLAHLKQRVLSGLGVSSLDVGETGATRSAADNVSQNLKDQIKGDLQKFCDLMRMHFFKEWFQEANYTLSIQKALATTHIRFKEIDIDNKLKLENHWIQLWLNDAITSEEFRHGLLLPALTKKDVTATHSYIANEYAIRLAESGAIAKAANPTGANAPAANMSKNRARPANQHGVNPAATKAKSSYEGFPELLMDNLIMATEVVQSTNTDWCDAAIAAVDSAVSEFNNKETNLTDSTTYTIQPCIDKVIDVAAFKSLVTVTDDLEILSILINNYLDNLEEKDGEQRSPNQEYQSGNE